MNPDRWQQLKSLSDQRQPRLARHRQELSGLDRAAARLSPDENWICFIGSKNDDAGDGAIYVMPAAATYSNEIVLMKDFK